MSLFDFFTDSVLRAPTIGAMLMAFVSSLVGVIAFVRRRSLVGEALSHATYPGVILAVVAGSYFFQVDSFWMAPCILVGALIFALFGLWVMDRLEHRFSLSQDASLCFVLASFFGFGLLIASRVQFTHPVLYRQIESYLYGEVATMMTSHLLLFVPMAFVVALVITALFKEIQLASFDRAFGFSIGLSLKAIDAVVMVLIVISVIMGIRSVGVVLMSAMLIAPPAAARQLTDRLSTMFLLSALFGVASAFLGVYLSVIFSQAAGRSVPTGPMIVLVSCSAALLSFLFAPAEGVVVRGVRILRFRYRCVQEHILKTLWRLEAERSTQSQLKGRLLIPSWQLIFALGQLIRQGWVEKEQGYFQLTSDGKKRAAMIVRLHRLWEVYLVEYVGVAEERVHRSAEEMEHILTPELERELTELLQDPTSDPHEQPIPRGPEVLA